MLPWLYDQFLHRREKTNYAFLPAAKFGATEALRNQGAACDTPAPTIRARYELLLRLCAQLEIRESASEIRRLRRGRADFPDRAGATIDRGFTANGAHVSPCLGLPANPDNPPLLTLEQIQATWGENEVHRAVVEYELRLAGYLIDALRIYPSF